VDFNGKKVASRRQIQLMVAQTTPGKKVNVKVVREGKEISLPITVGNMPEGILSSNDDPQSREHPESEMDSLDGVEVVDLDAEARKEANIPSNINGALVTNVDPESNSFEGGLRPGNIILEIDKHPVRNADEAVKLSEKATRDTVLLRIYRPGRGRGSRGTMDYLTINNSKKK
jgi:serine protease Do